MFTTNGTNSLIEHLPRSGSGSSDLYPLLQIVLEEVRKEIAILNRVSDGYPPRSELKHLIQQASQRVGLDLSSRERDQILLHLEGDRDGYGILQPLVDDESISDIICASYRDISVQRSRVTTRTPISFASLQDYEGFVERLLYRAGATYSTKTPIADGVIDGFARIHAVHKSICRGGPYLTIRLNRYSSVSPKDIVRSAFASEEILDYLLRCVWRGLSMVVVGEVGTGKTTLSRVLAGAIPQDESILVIEDTPEIKLDHPFVRYMQTRVENTEGQGRVSPAQCIKAGMRMSMNRIIFGEIRDAEAAESFIDCCSSGHPGLTTVHAFSSAEAIVRLMLLLGRAQPNVSREVLHQQIATAVKVIVYVGVCRKTRVRRVMEIREVIGFVDDVLRSRPVYTYCFDSGSPTWRKENDSFHLDSTVIR